MAKLALNYAKPPGRARLDCAVPQSVCASNCGPDHRLATCFPQHLAPTAVFLRLWAMMPTTYGLCSTKGTYEMTTFIRTLFIALLICGPAALSGAQDASTEELRSLDDQVQEIKSDVLGIASELSNLEERLLYPSNTQVALFVTLASDETFRLDAVKIEIDGELAAHHIYSFNELEALHKGGVQRIYTGNVPTGNHELSVSIMGKLGSGTDFTDSDSFMFAKGIEPKALGITLAGPGLGNNGIQVGDW